MANIAILNFCNLRCPYCFADDMIHEKSISLDVDDFRKMLDFLSRTPKNHVGIIGGEPTLHPHFSDIIKEVNKYCRELNTGATLFTNGIELEKYLPELSDRIGLLINCNDPDTMGPEFSNKQESTLDKLFELSWFDRRANIGCNVYPGKEDYSYIWKICDRYRIDHLRTSVVSPGGCFASLRSDKEKYYEDMVPVFIKHCENAIKHHVKLNMDCGHIPTCYFDSEQIKIAEEACENLYGAEYCEPVVDITPDFKATACFGAYDPVDIRDFPTLIELERYLMLTKTAVRAEANCVGRCTMCKKHELKICQGGCLGFANLDKKDENKQEEK
jgi:hypothetical protein